LGVSGDEIVLYAEGVSAGVYTLDVWCDADGDGPMDFTYEASAEITVVGTGGTVANAHQAVAVAVNDADADDDGVIDYADGFDADDGAADHDDENASADGFAAVQIILPSEGINPQSDQIRFSYSGSNPGGVTFSADGGAGAPYHYSLPDGALRLWTAQENVTRDKRPVGQGGHFVVPGSDYTISQLNPVDETITVYLEAVRPTPTDGEDIVVWLNVGGFGAVPTHWIAVTAQNVDVRADSDNDGAIEDRAGAGGLAEDQVENNNPAAVASIDADLGLDRPGVIVGLNDGDADGDGVPDWADGYNFDGLEDVAGGSTDDDYVATWPDGYEQRAAVRFTPIEISLPDGIDVRSARLGIDYEASDPTDVWDEELNDYALPAEGALRLWTRAPYAQDDNRRSGEPFYDLHMWPDENEPGLFVPSTDGYYAEEPVSGLSVLEMLGFSDTQRVVTLYAEGVRPSAAIADQQITVRVDQDGLAVEDTIRLTLGAGDVDIDSDNTSEGAPQRNHWEEAVEDLAGQRGKIVVVNDADADGDEVPDFADGYSGDGTAGDFFVPMVVEIPAWLDVSTAVLAFDYDASDPALAVAQGGADPWAYALTDDGSLRLWTRQAWEARNGDELANGGHWLCGLPDTWYAAADLGFSEQDREVTLYVEAVRPSRQTGDLRVEVWAAPTSEASGNDRLLLDSVRLTAVRADAADHSLGLVRTYDGAVVASETDLSSGGYGGWDLTRTYTRGQPGLEAGGTYGNGWSFLPYLVQGTSTIVLVAEGQTRCFDFNGDLQSRVYRGRFADKGRLTYEGGTYRLFEPDGSVWRFHDFDASLPAAQRGAFAEYRNPAGKATAAVYRPDGLVGEIRRGLDDPENPAETFVFQYADLAGATRLGKLSLQRRGENGDVRYAAYEYYAAGANHGTAGDLKAVTVRTADGGWLDKNYYRYYTTTGGDGVAGALRSVVGLGTYDRLCGEGHDPRTVPQATLDAYADVALTYVGDPRIVWFGRAKLQFLSGGLGDWTGQDPGRRTFAYLYLDNAPRVVGPNAWLHKTWAAELGVSMDVLHTNFAGQTMLAVEDPYDAAGQWCYATGYTARGQAAWQAGPSAVAGYSEDDLALVALHDDQGLVHSYTYHDGTEGPAGYLKAESVSKGQARGRRAAGDLLSVHVGSGVPAGVGGRATPERELDQRGLRRLRAPDGGHRRRRVPPHHRVRPGHGRRDDDGDRCRRPGPDHGDAAGRARPGRRDHRPDGGRHPDRIRGCGVLQHRPDEAPGRAGPRGLRGPQERPHPVAHLRPVGPDAAALLAVAGAAGHCRPPLRDAAIRDVCRRADRAGGPGRPDGPARGRRQPEAHHGRRQRSLWPEELLLRRELPLHEHGPARRRSQRRRDDHAHQVRRARPGHRDLGRHERRRLDADQHLARQHAARLHHAVRRWWRRRRERHLHDPASRRRAERQRPRHGHVLRLAEPPGGSGSRRRGRRPARADRLHHLRQPLAGGGAAHLRSGRALRNAGPPA